MLVRRTAVKYKKLCTSIHADCKDQNLRLTPACDQTCLTDSGHSPQQRLTLAKKVQEGLDAFHRIVYNVIINLEATRGRLCFHVCKAPRHQAIERGRSCPLPASPSSLADNAPAEDCKASKQAWLQHRSSREIYESPAELLNESPEASPSVLVSSLFEDLDRPDGFAVGDGCSRFFPNETEKK